MFCIGRGSYQVQLDLVDGIGRTASARLRHKASGQITATTPLPHGDEGLAAILSTFPLS